MITKVIVNHIERNYFNDYDEIRTAYEYIERFGKEQ